VSGFPFPAYISNECQGGVVTHLGWFGYPTLVVGLFLLLSWSLLSLPFFESPVLPLLFAGLTQAAAVLIYVVGHLKGACALRISNNWINSFLRVHYFALCKLF